MVINVMFIGTCILYSQQSLVIVVIEVIVFDPARVQVENDDLDDFDDFDDLNLPWDHRYFPPGTVSTVGGNYFS